MIGKSIYMLNLTENYIFYLHPQLLSPDEDSQVQMWISLTLMNHALHLMLCVLPKCMRVAKYTWCLSGLCRVTWNYFQLQQNC